MARLTRRSLIRVSLGLMTIGALARPHIANRAATTAEVWWPQGFVPEEDTAIKKIVADYEKASGNKIAQHRALRATTAEDRGSDADRYRPGSLSQQPGRDHRALCLGRQTGRCRRCYRAAKGPIRRHRAAQQLLLQQG